MSKNIFYWLNFLINGVQFNTTEITNSSNNITIGHFSYTWADGLLQNINYENFNNWLQQIQGKLQSGHVQTNDSHKNNNQLVRLVFNNLQPGFVTKMHTVNKQSILQKITKSWTSNYKQLKPENLDIIKVLSLLTKEVDVPLIYVQADFAGLKLVQAVPVSYGLRLKWDFKQVVVKFKDVNILSKKLLYKIEPFLSENLSISDMHNLIFNFVNFPTFKSTDNRFLDFLRSLLLEYLIEALEHVNIPELDGGLLLFTGEIPAILSSDAYGFLSLIDGLLLRGIWGIYYDSAFLIPNLMYILQNKLLPKDVTSFNVLFNNMDLFFSAWSSEVPILEVASIPVKKFIGKVGSIARFKFNKQATTFYARDVLENKNLNYELILPKSSLIKSLIIDNRKRPIEYGPSALTNKSRIMTNISQLSRYEA